MNYQGHHAQQITSLPVFFLCMEAQWFGFIFSLSLPGLSGCQALFSDSILIRLTRQTSELAGSQDDVAWI